MNEDIQSVRDNLKDIKTQIAEIFEPLYIQLVQRLKRVQELEKENIELKKLLSVHKTSMADETKVQATTRSENAVSAAKYNGISGTLGGAIVVILAWLLTYAKIIMPSEVGVALTVILSFIINIALARSGVISDTE